MAIEKGKKEVWEEGRVRDRRERGRILPFFLAREKIKRGKGR